jgi:RNA polymerase-binding transcription factor DksA
MTNFPDEILEGIRKHLEAEKTALVARIDEITVQDPFSDPERLNDNAAVDMEATEEDNHDRVTAVIDELKLKLSDINSALVRIGEGKYGFCQSCGNMIDTDRLNILPTAVLCLSCEEKQNK